jgi:streptomycin 6-kinase
MVAGRPSGAAPPDGEYAVVAGGLDSLHSRAARPGRFPALAGYLQGEVLPRISRRVASAGSLVPDAVPGRPAVLHRYR